MPENRFYIDEELKDTLKLEGEEFVHLSVMRKKVGETIELINGKNLLASAEIVEMQKRSAKLKVALVEEKAPLSPKIILAQALPRFNRLEYIIEKGTELGVTEFWLFPTSHSEKKELSATKLTRLKALMIAAMKQCGRLDLPEIHFKPMLSKWQKPRGAIFFGDVRDKADYFSKIPHDALTLFIGPEGGFTDEEVEFLEKRFHATGVKLHPNILRVDTASLAALSQIIMSKENLIVRRQED